MGRKAGSGGVSVQRRTNSIRLVFFLNGERIYERLTLNGESLPPTPANLKYADKLANEIWDKIKYDRFKFADYFPDSPRASAEAEDDGNPKTLGALLDLFVSAKGQLTPSTKDQYGTAARFWKKLLGETRHIEDITHIWLAAKIGGYPWPSAKTYNNYMIVLRGALGLVYRGPDALKSPMVGIKNLKLIKRPPDPLTKDERDLMLADIKAHYDPRVYAYFLWQFYTGMRPEEAIALRWGDIDWVKGTAWVRRVRVFKGSERDGSKTHSERIVDLLPQAIEALKIMKSYTFMLKVERKGDSDTTADIFQNPVTGKAWHDERSQRDHYWKPAIKRTGVRYRTPYHTRHTFATVALMTGVPPAYIAAQLGHSVKMLLDKYARWIPGGDGGGARAMLEKLMGDDAKVCQTCATDPEAEDKPLNFLPNIGRRDWTRTK